MSGFLQKVFSQWKLAGATLSGDHQGDTVTEDHQGGTVTKDHQVSTLSADHQGSTLSGDHQGVTVSKDHPQSAVPEDHQGNETISFAAEKHQEVNEKVEVVVEQPLRPEITIDNPPEDSQIEDDDIDSLCDEFYEKEEESCSNKQPHVDEIPLLTTSEWKSYDSLSINSSCEGNCGCKQLTDETVEVESFVGNMSSSYSLQKCNGGGEDERMKGMECGGGKSCQVSSLQIPYECEHHQGGAECASEYQDDDDVIKPYMTSHNNHHHHQEATTQSSDILLHHGNHHARLTTSSDDSDVIMSSTISTNNDQIQTNNISTCGTIDIALQFSLSDKKLQITVVEARDLPSKDRGGSSVLQVRLVILPLKKKRFRTKVQHITSPKFAETFKLTRISPEDLQHFGVRIRLYGIGKMKDRLIGEASLRFDEVNLIRDPQLTLTLLLEPRADVNRSDMELLQGTEVDEGNVKLLTHGGATPELLISLSYVEITGKLCVEIVKGSHFRNLAMSKPPDTFVKVVLLNSAFQEMAHSKTSLRKNQPNPVYKESFYFQVASFQLAEVSLMISVYISHTLLRRKDIFGWISMGKNSSSDYEDQHWKEMCQSPAGGAVSRWHTLIDS